MALMIMTACGGESEAARLVDPGQVEPQALQAEVADEPIRQFYEARDWRPAWTRHTVPGLVETMGSVARHGLDPRDFMGPVEQAGNPAAREAALTRAAFQLADALGNGQVDPRQIFPRYTLPRPRPRLDVAAGLSEALANRQVGEWLEALAPATAEYRALSQAYVDYAEQAAQGERAAIEDGDLIREGDSDPRVPQIVEALRANGYLGEGTGPADRANLYTAELAAAVERMQQDYAIAADGVVGPDTLEVLNAGPAERARTLAVNLERLRWLARRPPGTRVDVNVAAATMEYYRDGQVRDRRKAIVGQPEWETPQLGSPIFRLVANPTWTVPRSIEEHRIAPQGEAYLRRNNMVRRDGWVVQLSGPDNALGLVKFDMHNDNAIFLHDTPAKDLFGRNQRHFSHGCVRVEDALGFARMLAREAGVLDEFERALESGSETFVDLPENIPVRLLYLTAFVDGSGNVAFRTDPYGWDDRVAEALGYEPRPPRRLRPHFNDLGP